MERSFLSLKKEPPLNKVPNKLDKCVRYLSFNVNGVRTLFNHHPWNQLQNSLCEVFSALQADVVSLQELKIQIGGVAEKSLAKGYKSFISISKVKKGYSGVGLYVRVPTADEPASVRQALTVVKAEEGITGSLKDANGKRYRDLQSTESIGGYLDDESLSNLGVTEADLVALDSEGRCVIIETANNCVIVSLYCPANSSGTEEGQRFRLQFLAVMLERCTNLERMGKRVVIMGDINVSPDLIDNAEGINDRLKQKLIKNNLREGGVEFEEANAAECLAFRTSAEHRELLNQYVVPSLPNAPPLQTQLFFDTTRVIQKRKLSLYTVWNTQTNARQANFGSRIDLILMSSKEDVANIQNADILPYILGSDHCPVFTDIDVSSQAAVDYVDKKLAFEAHSFYKLVKHYDISTMFSKKPPETPLMASPVERSKRPASKPIYVDRKKPRHQNQQPIGNFLFSSRPKKEEKPSTAPPHDVVSAFASKVYNTPPTCEHQEICILKTSMTPQTKGKKFWCCPRISKGSTVDLGEHRCNFFEWARRPTD